MTNINKIIVFLLSFVWLFAVSTAQATDLNTPVGYWKTIDDITQQPKSIVQISETPEGMLQAQVMKIYPSPGKDEHELCSACNGENHNKPIVGMVILWGMKKDNNQWDGGRILDPKTGNIYRCNLKLKNAGQELSVHG